MQEPVDLASSAVPSRAESRLAQVSPRDLVTLAKPRITLMVVITAAGGLFLSRRMPGAEPLSLATILSTLVGCALIVCGANALNMYIERDVDRRMDRTKNRPLPAGRKLRYLTVEGQFLNSDATRTVGLLRNSDIKLEPSGRRFWSSVENAMICIGETIMPKPSPWMKLASRIGPLPISSDQPVMIHMPQAAIR